MAEPNHKDTRLREIEHLLQKQQRKDFFDNPVQSGWITAYATWRNPNKNGAIYSVLVPTARLSETLSGETWNITIGGATPGCTIRSQKDGTEVLHYNRFGNDEGVEPLVLVRDFDGARDQSLEVVEEFRLFPDLFWNERNRTYLRADRAGNDHEVVRMSDDRVLVRAPELRQFLSIRELTLVLLIDSVANSDLQPDEVPEGNDCLNETSSVHCLALHVIEDDFGIGSGRTSFSRLLGKRAVAGGPKSKCGLWPFNEDESENYPEFIVGADDNGDPVRFTCQPDKLANYFGANPEAPHYLTPVHFRRDVLQRYYSNSQSYSVEDGLIRCRGRWLLRIDNHLENSVSAYLGDLGRDLPESERDHWLPHVILADEGISGPKLQRDFQGEPADPVHPDLLFKHRFEQFQTAWFEKNGWSLFLPLASGDVHRFKTLREPIQEDQGEFDSQVLALTKLLVDSLNEKQLANVVESLPADAKGISKLECYLRQEHVAGTERIISFFRALQALRSTGVGHRKGKKYEKTLGAFGLPEAGLRRGFLDILQRALDDVLLTLGAHFLPDSWK